MHLHLSDEQRMVQKAIRKFVEKELSTASCKFTAAWAIRKKCRSSSGTARLDFGAFMMAPMKFSA
ncbi:Butyryl-CoA dehydrogenase [Parageobacillus toebii]|uniref:Butyryl-CoA dehydrogenase n=2 Tax=Anoxybacillaceae TaxID=3120669 RepID=A0A150MFC6_9BACL|nr:Butyryl-CoA dehydrogenase [Parageobacillus toebii]